MELMQAAVEYAERGWLVFPLHGITDSNRCTCGGTGCSSPGKHPRTMSGFKDASRDPERVRRWWTDYPDSNIGVVTGEGSGIVVVDADSEEAAEAWLWDQEPTLTALTGKGSHYYYKHPGVPIKNAVRFRSALDIRGDGGYVVAPPSKHVSGNDYEWASWGAKAPVALPSFLLPDAETRAPAPGTERPAISAPIIEGGRNATLTRHVGVLFGKQMRADEVLPLALGLNLQLCQPPLPVSEVERIVRNIANAEWAKRPDLGTVDPMALAAGYAADALADMAVDYSTLPSWFSPNLHAMLGPPTPGSITVVGARPGCAKTTFMANQAQHLVDLGHKVFYIGTEMKPSLLLRKFAANALGYDERYALKNDWAALPHDAVPKIQQWIADFQRAKGTQLVFCPDWVLDGPKLVEWVKWAGDHGYKSVILDHLHEIEWGEDETRGMAAGFTELVTTIKERDVFCYAAGQVRRGQHDEALVDYYPPPQSALKQCGKIEEKAELIIMLHRTLKADAKAQDLDAVKRGQAKIATVAEHGVVSAHIAKDRFGGQRDESLRLYLNRGRLLDRAYDTAPQDWEDV